MTKAEYATAEVCCIGKDKLQSMNLARDIAKRMARVKGTPIAAYKCPHCGAYHVGNESKKGKFHGKPRQSEPAS
jgi:tryptophanyl-tRNA synthetase